jgi:U3 small nucleolar RNA-associated protein 6
MAEQVQALMERMVTPLRDLRDRGIFTEEEIHQIVTRRRASEYLLQKLSVSRSDYLRYIEAEILLEKLRKLRKQKVLQEWTEKLRGGHDDADEQDSNHGNSASSKKKHAYQTSGPGDSHILSNIHFLYQRLLKKFHYPIDVILNYAEFAKEHKSFNVMSRVYAEGLQRHPREEGLWIQAASFEFFGHVARDDTKSESTKLVGSSIQNARVLMQRGIRINGKTSQELWIQYFALELHYVIKLLGRKEILEGGASSDESDDDEDNTGRDTPTRITNTKLLPCQIIYKNAIKSIPNSLSFRLRFVETCRMFPRTKELERYIMDTIEDDFGDCVEGWVSRISFAEDLMKKRSMKNAGGEQHQGFLAVAVNDAEEEEEPRAKKRRVIVKDTALELVNEALEALPTAQMYLECARYLQLRIRRLVEFAEADQDEEEDEVPSEDVSYLLSENEDAESAVKRHSSLLKELYSKAQANGVRSSGLTLDQVDFLSSNGEMEEADELMNQALHQNGDTNAKLFLQWASLSQEMVNRELTPKLSPASILRKGLAVTPIHDRDAYLLLSTELMKLLMSQPPNDKVTKELKSMFQKLLLTSQGITKPSASNDEADTDEMEVNLPQVLLAYLEYTIPQNKQCTLSDNEAVRSIYNSVIFHSNFAKTCLGKNGDEIMAMKSFFDMCLHFETSMAAPSVSEASKSVKKQKKQRLSKLYEAAIVFFRSGGGGESVLRSVVDGYQREFDNMKFGL